MTTAPGLESECFQVLRQRSAGFATPGPPACVLALCHRYVEINFNKKGVISGAAIRTYLLERSRVVAVNNPERNYHIFYQLCEGASPAERQKWFLGKASDYRYLNQSTCFQLTGVDNAEEYKVSMTPRQLLQPLPA
jgi:hypothetical protein